MRYAGKVENESDVFIPAFNLQKNVKTTSNFYNERPPHNVESKAKINHYKSFDTQTKKNLNK